MALPWVRLDSHIASHDKILALVDDKSVKKWQAFSSYICALGWSADQGTDGYVPKTALPFVHGTTTTARLLVKYGLWDEDRLGLGWHIRNFADRQETAAVSAGKRAARAYISEKGNCARWHGPGCWQADTGCKRASL